MARLAVIKSLSAAFTSLLVLLATSARAEDKDEITYSYYLISCGSFIEHRQPSESNSYNSTADTFYVAGWLSAYNRLRPEEGIPDDTSIDDVMLWLEQYCRKNPLSNLETGLFELGSETKPRHETLPPQAPAKPAPAHVKPPAPLVQSHSPVPGLKPLTE